MSWERWLYAWRARLRAFLYRDRANRELDDELQYHVARETEVRRASGVPAAEARRQALAALGGLESTREHVRASRCGASLEAGLRDVRHGLRLLRRQPGFTAATVLTLALSIGATTAIFSFVDAVLLQPPPFPEPERLVTLWQTDPDDGNRPVPVGPADFLDWRDRVRSFERVAAIDPWSLDFTGAGEPEIFTGSLVTEGFFEMLGVNAVHGRTFLPEEYLPGSGVIVLTDGLWQRRFGGEADIIGRPLVLEGEPYTVIGVLGPDFELGLERRGERDFFLPKTFSEYETSSRGPGWWRVMGRLRSEVTLAEAQAEMDAVAARLAQEHPRTNADVGARVIPLQARQVEAVRPTLLLLQGAVLFVLLIACVNVANLMLALCTRRAPEFAVRMAVGGGRGRRRPRPPAAPTADRERRDRGPGRRRRLRLRRRLARGDHGVHAGRRAASGAGRRESAAPRVRRRPRRPGDPGVRDGARPARGPAERARPAPRPAHRRQRGAAAAAPGTG